MTAKTGIVDELGVDALLVPAALGAALEANERAKYLFTLLQTAAAHAADPEGTHSSLTHERAAAGVDDAAWDEVVAGARAEPDGRLRIPRAAEIVGSALASVEAMLAPLERAPSGADAGVLRARLDRLRAALPEVAGESVPGGLVAGMTHASRERGDSLHLLVMDLHRALVELQASLAEESVDGAQAYALEDDDRRLVRAFMAGLNRTAPLKFDHPGLGTTATRAGARLVIQNDIGTTDAHVLVVHVEGRAATVTYTDVHLPRARFFQSLFHPFDVAWEATSTHETDALPESASYHLCRGRFEADDDAELESYLRFLGSRIVYLIDWNRARKRLRNFVRKRDAIALLAWAADHDYGHRAFLQLGGEQLIHEAVEYAAPTPVRYGQRLDDLLGRDATIAFLQHVLRTASGGLLAGRSAQLVRDEVKAELVHYFRSAQQGLLDLAAEHATLVFELAREVHEGLLPGRIEDRARMRRVVRRARRWEREADEVVGRARATGIAGEAEVYRGLVAAADDAADGLEEAAFLVGLLPGLAPPETLWSPLRPLAGAVVDGAQEFVKCVCNASLVHRGAPREDVQDFLEAVDRLVTLEHATDDAERVLLTHLVDDAVDPRHLHLLARIGEALEETSDVLARCGLMLRDHALAEAIRR